MDLEKTIKFVGEHASAYVATLIQTLKSPRVHQQAVVVTPNTLVFASPHALEEPSHRLHPTVLEFVAISIFLGLTLNGITVEVARTASFAYDVAFVALFWLFEVSLLHAAARLAGGSGSYLDSLAVALQVWAAIFVVTAFATPIILSVAPFVSDVTADSVQALALPAHFAVSTLLLLIYAPLAIKDVHGFGLLRALVICAAVLALTTLVAMAVTVKDPQRPAKRRSPPRVATHSAVDELSRVTITGGRINAALRQTQWPPSTLDVC